MAILGLDVPNPIAGIGKVGFGGVTSAITTILLIVIIVILLCVGIYIFYLMKLYNKKIIVYENISGQGYQKTYTDTARLIKLGDGGEEILYLRKKKVYRTAYGKKMGTNEYWFAIGQDGYWYNVVLGDLDAKMGMLDIEPIDRDMRYMHVAVRKNITERYRKQNFMDKYGAYIMIGIAILVLMIGTWFNFDKQAEIAKTNQQGADTYLAVAEKSQQILSSLDNVCSGGSGIVSATVEGGEG